jgi:AraC family transcriptional regulator of adaptative response/methylated-DNA-[protein]-cysteine methyltransferase
MMDQLVNYYRIERAIGYLTANFKAQPDLDTIAAKVHMSPYHFQRIFTDWVGISPKKFLQYLTLDHLKQKIKNTENMIAAADEAGLSSQSRVNELFVKIEGVSPQQYKSGGAGLGIIYGYHASPFGLCFIAVAEKGICALKFIDEDRTRDEFAVFTREWPQATLVHDPARTQRYIRKIFQYPANPPADLQLLVKGTDFQIKVWEALVDIPFGSVSSFQQVARLIGQPEATRAVGAAVAANSILYLIPCHRIITKDGKMGDYHFGKTRKMAMIGWESSQLPQK